MCERLQVIFTAEDLLHFNPHSTHILLPSMRLQHSGEEAIGEGEAGEPEQFGWVGGLGPQLKLTDPLAKISGPRCQGLQRWVGLTHRDKRPHKLANNI